MRIALDAGTPAPVTWINAATAGELRAWFASLPPRQYGGYRLAVEVHDPVSRTATWHPISPFDGEQMRHTRITVRGGLCSRSDAELVWRYAQQTAAAWRLWHKKLRLLTECIVAEMH